MLHKGIRIDQDLTGNRYGKLVVTGFAFHRPSDKKNFWKCKCDCGNETTAYVGSLRATSGGKNSCGCAIVSYRNRIATRASQVRRVYSQYKKDAERRNLPFELTLESWYTLSQKPCYYCGLEYSNSRLKNRSNPNGLAEEFKYNGIDRMDNAVGYTQDNCVPCCKTCNMNKKTAHTDEFLMWISKVYQFKNNTLPAYGYTGI